MAVKGLLATGTRRRRVRLSPYPPPSPPAHAGRNSFDPARPGRRLGAGATNGFLLMRGRRRPAARPAPPPRPTSPGTRRRRRSRDRMLRRRSGSRGGVADSVPGCAPSGPRLTLDFILSALPLGFCVPVPPHLSPAPETSLATSIGELFFPLSIKPGCLEHFCMPGRVLSTKRVGWGQTAECGGGGCVLGVPGERAYFCLGIWSVHLEEEAFELSFDRWIGSQWGGEWEVKWSGSKMEKIQCGCSAKSCLIWGAGGAGGVRLQRILRPQWEKP